MYVRNSEKWQHKFPIVQDEFQVEDLPIKYTTESWLDDRVDSKTGTWGSVVSVAKRSCKEKTEGVAVGVPRLRKVHRRRQGVDFTTLRRHHILAAHVEAARAYVGLGKTASSSLISAPTVEEFECVRETVVKKKKPRQGRH